MDILVCATQVPFMRGGLELHIENLVAALLAAGHRAETVLLPTAWDRERLLDAAFAWRMVPLDADLVIAMNFPSYFARHPNKVVWLPHQHRAAYDGVDTAWSDFRLDELSLADQAQLADWDTRVLEEAVALFSTSREVSNRLARYNGLAAVPLYHPPPLADALHDGPFGDYVFCPTRLEGNKRPELVVEAMSFVRSGVRGVLAGRGTMAPALEDLRERLGVADGLSLPGFVPDDELVASYAGALAVIYAPFEEDYGYVTIQAFLAGKPVITSHDAGGVLEWVEDDVTGIVTDGSPAAIGAAIDRLAADRELAARLGRNGRERVAGLSWKHVVDTLVAAGRP